MIGTQIRPDVEWVECMICWTIPDNCGCRQIKNNSSTRPKYDSFNSLMLDGDVVGKFKNLISISLISADVF